MFGITDLTTFIIGTILIVLLPGPNSLYVMSVASRYGIRTGYAAACGVFTGDSILILCTVLGAASLLEAFPILFIVLKLTGACYLAYLVFKLLQSAYQTWNKPTHPTEMGDLPRLDQIHPNHFLLLQDTYKLLQLNLRPEYSSQSSLERVESIRVIPLWKLQEFSKEF